MDANFSYPKRTGETIMTISRWFLLLGLLIVFGFTSAWPSNQSPVKAAEPDLSLLKQAYASSAFQTQIYAELGSPMVIPAAAFNPDSNTRAWSFGFNSSFIYPNSTAQYCGIAAILLPDRALITSLKGYVYDNDPAHLVDVYLYAKPLGSTVNSTSVAHLQTTIGSTSVQLIEAPTFSPIRVDNAAYTYHIGVCTRGIDNLIRFYAVRIDYLQELYLPIISR